MPGSRTGSGSGNPEKPDRALVPDDNRGVYGQALAPGSTQDVPDPVRIQTVRIRIRIRVQFWACSISNERSWQARSESTTISRFSVDPENRKNRIFHFWQVVSQIKGLGKPVWNLQIR